MSLLTCDPHFPLAKQEGAEVEKSLDHRLLNFLVRSPQTNAKTLTVFFKEKKLKMTLIHGVLHGIYQHVSFQKSITNNVQVWNFKRSIET